MRVFFLTSNMYENEISFLAGRYFPEDYLLDCKNIPFERTFTGPRKEVRAGKTAHFVDVRKSDRAKGEYIFGPLIFKRKDKQKSGTSPIPGQKNRQ